MAHTTDPPDGRNDEDRRDDEDRNPAPAPEPVEPDHADDRPPPKPDFDYFAHYPYGYLF